MVPEIVHFPKTKFIGYNLELSFSDYRIFELWQRFMPHRSAMEYVIGTDLYNVQRNPEGYDFNPQTAFKKWACRPVSALGNIPEGMEVLDIPEGLYAVFHYKGNPSQASVFFKQIYTVWLPSSGYVWENRPQFEVLGKGYNPTSDDSEELIYIPIRKNE